MKNKTKIGKPQIAGGIKVVRILKNWTDYFKEFYGKFNSNDNVIFSLRSGAKLIITPNSTDRKVFNEVWVYEEYNCKEGFDIKNNDIVVDIGANIGTFSIYAANKAENVKVYSFEPVKDNYRKLIENRNMNTSLDIIPINKAVSSKAGKRKIFLSSANCGGHSLFEGWDIGKDSEIIQTTTLKNIFEDNNLTYIDFLKIDCEGGEFEILESSKEILKRVKKISMEVHRISNDKNIYFLKSILEESGFDVEINTNSDGPLGMLYAINKSVKEDISEVGKKDECMHDSQSNDKANLGGENGS